MAMDQHTATEQSYKNGYEAGVQAAVDTFAERIRSILWEPRFPTVGEVDRISEEIKSKLQKR